MPQRDVALRFVVIFLPLCVVTGGIVAALYWGQIRADRAVLEVNHREHVKLQSEIIVSDFRSVVSDLMILAEGKALQTLLKNEDDASVASLAEEYRLFLDHKGIYDQARVLDLSGMELVRVNLVGRRAVVVRREELQTKRGRYYFTGTVRLGRGDVFVSPFDLNIERGHIEQPIKPTIRFGTPIFDAQGRKRGIVVLNYLGATLLAKLRRAAINSAGQVMLVNAEGYFLRGRRPEEEWGFMYPQRAEMTLGHKYPEAWRRIRTADAGQFSTANGIFTFRTVYPISRASSTWARENALKIRSASKDGEKAYHWIVVSRIGPARLAARSDRLFSGLVWMLSSLAAVLAMVSWFLARLSVQNRLAQQQLLRTERLAAIGQAMAGLAHESRNALQRSQAGLEMLMLRFQDHPESLELLTEIQTAQDYLHELYEEVRGYSAPLNLRTESVHLGKLLHQTWSNLRVQYDMREAQLLEEPSAVQLKCSVDPRMMGQVFRNILENALSAAEPAEVRVRWSDTWQNGQPMLRISICDNGPGLSPEQRRRIFDPFYTTKTRGTGLGMAITRRIVQAHGGQIVVGSDSECGAEIVIMLPRQ